MSIIFKITDVMGRDIILTMERWNSIIKENPLMEDYLKEIIQTIKRPDTLERKIYLKGYYYKRYPDLPNKFILVIAKYSEGRGEIENACLTDSI